MFQTLYLYVGRQRTGTTMWYRMNFATQYLQYDPEETVKRGIREMLGEDWELLGCADHLPHDVIPVPSELNVD